MSAEEFLTAQLRKFSLLDIALVKCVYLLVGLLVASQYKPLMMIDGWVYVTLVIICATPLCLRSFSNPGRWLEKSRAYLATNDPAHQVLLFLCMLFLALWLSGIFPVLMSAPWWAYLGLIAVLAIKPMTKTVFW